MSLQSGRSTVATGGGLGVASGEGTQTSSGIVAARAANGGASGASGRLAFSSGSSSAGNSGTVTIGSGPATSGRGGDVSVAVGSGTSSAGGALSFASGRSAAATGGHVAVCAGEGTEKSSGAVVVASANGGASGAARAAGVQLGLGQEWERRRYLDRLRSGVWRSRWGGERQRGQRDEPDLAALRILELAAARRGPAGASRSRPGRAPRRAAALLSSALRMAERRARAGRSRLVLGLRYLGTVGV